MEGGPVRRSSLRVFQLPQSFIHPLIVSRTSGPRQAGPILSRDVDLALGPSMAGPNLPVEGTEFIESRETNFRSFLARGSNPRGRICGLPSSPRGSPSVIPGHRISDVLGMVVVWSRGPSIAGPAGVVICGVGREADPVKDRFPCRRRFIDSGENRRPCSDLLPPAGSTSLLHLASCWVRLRCSRSQGLGCCLLERLRRSDCLQGFPRNRTHVESRPVVLGLRPRGDQHKWDGSHVNAGARVSVGTGIHPFLPYEQRRTSGPSPKYMLDPGFLFLVEISGGPEQFKYVE